MQCNKSVEKYSKISVKNNFYPKTSLHVHLPSCWRSDTKLNCKLNRINVVLYIGQMCLICVLCSHHVDWASCAFLQRINAKWKRTDAIQSIQFHTQVYKLRGSLTSSSDSGLWCNGPRLNNYLLFGILSKFL